jgi:transposase
MNSALKSNKPPFGTGCKGWTSALKKTIHAKEQDRTDVKQARECWRIQQVKWDPRKLVFLDETGLNTKMTRGYGWAPRSERCVYKSPHGHWQTNTFIAALRWDGLDAPWLLEGPMDGQGLQIKLREVLAPGLKEGDRVICDNLASHKTQAEKEILAEFGVEFLYLPPYSPDLNPIEMVFAKLKALLRKSEPETLKDLMKEVAPSLMKFSSAECSRYLQHSQYASY